MRPDDSEVASIITNEFGANANYVADLLRQFQLNPRSVGEEWGTYFNSLLGDGNGITRTDGAPPATPSVRASSTPVLAPKAVAAAPAPAPPETAAERVPIRGAALKIVENMEASLTVPTATSLRQVQIKVLDENRRWINRHLEANGRGKTSYTHFIAWAMIKSLERFPHLNDGYEEVDGAAYRVRRPDVNLGVAVDVVKKDGSHSLLVPSVKGVNHQTFSQFVSSYQDVVKRAREGKLQLADFQGTTLSLTNPGTIGTNASTPRLMAGQSLIVATGAIDFPPEYAAMTPEALSQLGISRVFTITSTYDHRIVQGAESGAFLALIHQLLLGQHRFYDEIFADLGIGYRPLRWSVDVNPALLGIDREREEIKKQAKIFEFINAYRVRGHLIADTDPLEMVPLHEHPELDIETYGLSIWDLDREFEAGGVGGLQRAPLREIWAMLIRFYGGKVGVEYRHIQSPEQKQWLRERIETDPLPIALEVKKQLLSRLVAAEQFERFLHTKYLGQKRFSVEGSETIIPLLDQLILGAASRGAEEIVLGMAHRGRLTVLANIIGNFSERIFTSFEGSVHPNFPADEGDVKHHQGANGERVVDSRDIRLTLSPNPSHLEFVDPVVEGMARAKQDAIGRDAKDEARERILAVLLHGDAAFAGQGIVTETLNLADLKGYRTGGTIHLIINNQIGFTTSPEAGRSSIYSTDVAKMTQLPIFHVNGDDVEAAYRVLQIALDFRSRFHKDVVIDLIGFRRHGHNEGDEPSYTQPLMYQRVREHPGVRELYTRQLLREGLITEEDVSALIEERVRRFDNALLGAKEIVARQKQVTELPEPKPEDDGSHVLETGISAEMATRISLAMGVVPQGFSINPKMVGQMARRAKMGEGTVPVDWAFAEGLAFGSLTLEGTSVRLSGQDSGRGTFSQRHAVLYDTRTGQPWVPLAELAAGESRFEVFDSSLSEAAVLGFEYGYSSIVGRDCLVLWEAQFGDFANGAQVIIDQFIAPSEDKWQQTSRLGLLLPHGYEGQGPEHSSARLERFLQLCAENNLQVCYPSTPAQYFHLLRRQMRQEASKPLIVMTPKSLLRLPQATSSLGAMTSGGFQPVIADTSEASQVVRLIICSGKVYYDLRAELEQSPDDRVAVLRVEQFYPFPQRAIRSWLGDHPAAVEIVWLQEEPQNMGAWSFIRPRLEALLTKGQILRYVGRSQSASPATGSYTIHQLEQKRLLSEALSLD